MSPPERRRLKRWVALFCILFAIGFALLNIFAYRNAFAMMHFKAGKPRTEQPESLGAAQKLKVLLCGVDIPRPHSSLPVAVLGPAAKSLRIDSDGNVKLGAWYCPGSWNSPLVILFHGYTSEKSSTLPEAKVFLELGCSVLLVDFRGSGDSSESYTTIGYVEAYLTDC